MSSRARVLVVEDDPWIREVMVEALALEGHEVAVATSGKEALDRVRQGQPDLILLDMRMPGMDGWEFARAYRSLPGGHAPIVAVTAARDAAQSAAQIGAVGYVAKPFDLDDLLAAVSRHARTA